MPDSELERYELLEPRRYEFALGRREFFRLTGAGLWITAWAPAEAAAPPGSVAARIHLGEDGRITVLTGKVEVGQGSRTELTQAAAEELGVAVEQVTLIMGDTALTPDDGGTFGSRTTPATAPAVRKAAAAARRILAELSREQGRRLDYADLARMPEAARRFERAVPGDVTLTPARDWKVLGASVARVNGRDIVTGAHRFPSDIVRPGMLYGKVLRPPGYGAALASLDLEPARRMPGVVVVRDGDFVGCAAPTSWRAQQALEAIARTASWNQTPHPSSRELFDYLKRHARPAQPGAMRTRGAPDSGLAPAQVLGAVYQTAYIQHAPLEPRAAVAEWQGENLTVWTGTQTPVRVRQELAEAFRLPLERVRVIVPDTGGAFGGKHTGEAAVEAARLAKAAAKPVSLRWSREEEFTWAYFRPAALIQLRAGLDEHGRIVLWEFTNINSGAAALESPYEIPHAKEQFLLSDSPLRQGSYRVLAATANNFARECFMDELAARAGADPLDFRLAHLQNERLRAVLDAAAGRFGWRRRRTGRGEGRGIGLACGTEKGSYVAACVEVEVDRSRGEIRVLSVTQAFECGAILNPANLKAQAEGCVIMALGGALKEEIRFENGRVLNARFSRYPVPRFADVPPIETILLDRRDLPSAGAGETPMIAVPPAVANAVFDACGVRLRSLPLQGEALKV